jgi:hypothetical protein
MTKFMRPKVDLQRLKPPIFAKWKPELLTEGYVPVPKRLLRTFHELFGGASEVDELVALLAIVDYKRANLKNLPSIEYLSFMAGIPQKEFNAALKRLKKRKWIEVEPNSDPSAVEITVDGLTAAALSTIGDEGKMPWIDS